MERKKVYLSGPERLLKDARVRFEEKKKLCESYGFKLLEYPEEVFLVQDSLENSERIARERLKLIRECDLLIADTRDFRAYVEPFGETALEMGMGFAYGKKMYCYMPDTRLCEVRYSGEKKYNEEAQRLEDADGIGFEPGPLNLMLEYSAKIVKGSLEDALKAAREDLAAGGV